MQVRGKGEEPHKDADGNVLQAEEAGTHVDISGQLLILAVGNGRQAGGGVQLCSKAGMVTTMPWPQSMLSQAALTLLESSNASSDSLKEIKCGTSCT